MGSFRTGKDGQRGKVAAPPRAPRGSSAGHDAATAAGWFTNKCAPGGSQTTAKALAQVQYDLKQLGVAQVDLVLLHAPCGNSSQDAALWRGLETALSMNLTRAIGAVPSRRRGGSRRRRGDDADRPERTRASIDSRRCVEL